MWKKIGKFLAVGVCLTVFAAPVFAGEGKINVSVNQKEILLGDAVILTVAVEGISNPETPELSPIPGFDVKFQGMRQERFSNMTVVVNGRQIRNENSGGGYKFNFELTPKTTGLLTVPEFSISVNGNEFTAASFQVNVLAQSEKRKDIFIDVQADETEAYLGEKILVTFKWYFIKNIGSYRINVPWIDGMKNFLVTDPELDKNRVYQRLIINGDKQIAALKFREFFKGQEYMVISFQKVLTPMAAGTYTLDSVFLKCDVVTGYKDAGQRSKVNNFFRSDFNKFFGFGRNAVTEPFSVRSDKIILKVKDVPDQDKPAAYSGAVGRFSFNVNVNPVSLKVGEPITLTMKVAGSGNIEQLKLPHMPDIESFKSYEPESKVNVSRKGGKIRGEKIFEKILIPRCEGDYQIPEVTFAFFNPETGKYQTEKRGPFKIHVVKAEKEDEIQVIAITSEGTENTQKRELKLLKKDIHYIMTDIGGIIRSEKPVYKNIVVWISVFLMPVLILAGMFVFGKRRERLNTDIAFARSRTALKNSKGFFKQAELASEKGNARDFYDFLIKGVNTYLAEKLNRQMGSIGITIVEELKAKGLKEKESSELTALYHHANEVVFSSAAVKPEKLKKDFRTANEIIFRLERILK